MANSKAFAQLVINVEAPLEGTFHYHVARDLRPSLQIGHLVEVEFGKRLAQGIIIAFDDNAPVEDTKPIIALIDEQPVVFWWQIELAKWMSSTYLAPLNACLRLMLPPGLTRWSDVTIDLNPYWDGNGRLTEIQATIITILKAKGDLRGRQLKRALTKEGQKGDWKTAVNQLAKRKIIRKASVLDPPRIKPKKIRTAELIASPQKWQTGVTQLGRNNKQADILLYLLNSDDPLPQETAVLQATNANQTHLQKLADAHLIRIDQAVSQQPSATSDQSPISNLQSPHHPSSPAPQPLISLTIPPAETIRQITTLRGATIL